MREKRVESFHVLLLLQRRETLGFSREREVDDTERAMKKPVKEPGAGPTNAFRRQWAA